MNLIIPTPQLVWPDEMKLTSGRPIELTACTSPTPTSNLYTGLGCECAKTLQRMCKLEGVLEDTIATKPTSGRQIREAPSSHFTLSQEIRQRPKLKKVPLHHWHLIVQSFPDQSCSFFNLISGDLLIYQEGPPLPHYGPPSSASSPPSPIIRSIQT